VNWYPGHMVKATKTIVDKLKACDLIIEVRDARVCLLGS
jgi:ribosome biogenesis GTPase A